MTPAPGTAADRANPVAHSAAAGAASLAMVFACWGLFPLYWKSLSQVPALEVVCHRTLWGLAFLVPLLWTGGRARELRAAFCCRRNLLFIGLGSAAHMTNWGLHIWGSGHGMVLEISLGSYILPLLSVLAGGLVFRERLRPMQWAAFAVAAGGVAAMALRFGSFPWLAVSIAATSAAFAVARKHAPAGAWSGLVLEFAFTLPLLGGYLAWLAWSGQSSMGRGDVRTDLLLAGAGAITALTQLLYNFGLRRTRMSTLGMLQYLMPTVSLLLGVLVLQERVTPAHATGFACIWAGIVLYTLDGRRALARP